MLRIVLWLLSVLPAFCAFQQVETSMAAVPKYFLSATDRFRICDVQNEGDTLQDVAEREGVQFFKGQGFYQVGGKAETVGPNKEIVLISKKYPSKGTANAKKARQLLQVGDGQKIQLKDTTSDKFWIFVQSTSANRKLEVGSRCLFRVDKEDQDEQDSETGGKLEESQPKTEKTEKPSAGSSAEQKAKRKKTEEASASSSAEPKTKRQKTEDVSVISAASSSSTSPAAVPSLTSVSYGSFPFGLTWTNNPKFLWVLSTDKLPGSPRVIGFDMDSTLIEPKSGKKFPEGRSDWKWWHPKVVPTLKQKHAEGYKLVIFSNQAGIGKKKVKPEHITGKILDLVQVLGFPVEAVFAGSNDHFRKPGTAMWDLYVQQHNQGVPVDLQNSMYVGDAAGRPKDWKKGAKKDFGDSDRAFAANIGVPFMTPEMFFLSEKAPPMTWRSFDPASFLAKVEKKSPPPQAFEGSSLAKPHPEMVIFVGFPACGKSSYATKKMSGYEWINRDTLKTPKKCLQGAEAALKAGKSVVVDNTSPTADARDPYIKLAKKYKAPVRCFRFTADKALCMHLNWVRVKQTKGAREHIPDIAFNMFSSKLQEPQPSEGFSEICKVNFVPAFPDASARKLFLERN
eukprot:g48898.t1